MRKVMAVLVAAVMLLMASTAMATQITGYIDFTGVQQLSDSQNNGATTIGNADTITFTNPATVAVTTDGFTAIPDGTDATLTSFYFGDGIPAGGVIPLWTVTTSAGTYSFDLLSLTVDRHDGKTLELYGSGVIHAPGFDDTYGVWDLTTQSSNGVVRGRLSFSSDTTAETVPEPGTMMLLGAGLLSLSIYGKRRRSS